MKKTKRDPWKDCHDYLMKWAGFAKSVENYTGYMCYEHAARIVRDHMPKKKKK